MIDKILFTLTAFFSFAKGASSTNGTGKGQIQPFGYHMKLEELVGTEMETIDTVMAMVMGPYWTGLDAEAMCTVKKADVFEYLMNYASDEKQQAQVAFKVLSEKLTARDEELKFKDDFHAGSESFEIVKCCLDKIPKSSDLNEMFQDLYFRFIVFVTRGNVEIVKSFIDAGLKVDEEVQSTLPMGLFVIENNFEPIVKELIRGGMSASSTAKSVANNMDNPKLTPSLFEFLLEKGLPVNHKRWGLNWMELCHAANRVDLGFVVCKHGVKLNSQYQNEFVRALALKLAQEHAYQQVRVLFAAQEDSESSISVFPKELLMEQANFLLENMSIEDYFPLIMDQA